MALKRMPRPGELIQFAHHNFQLKVHHVEKNIVWCAYPSGELLPFIGQFLSDESFNNLATIVDAEGKEVS